MIDQPVRKEFCRCPYCDAVLEEPSPICKSCEIVFITCVKCQSEIREGLDICPICGQAPR